MEESKEISILICIEKTSQITEAHVAEHFGATGIRIQSTTSPKGFRVFLDSTKATEYLEKETDTLKDESIIYAEDDNFCTLFIRGINSTISELDLSSALSSEGKICMTSIKRDSKFQPIGSAFVRYTRKENALKAAEKYKTLEINSVQIECSKFEPKQTNTQKETIIEQASFRNLPANFSEESARELFGQYGVVTSLTLDEAARTGTVEFSTVGSVNKIIQGLNGRKFEDPTGVLDPAQPAFLISDDKKKSSTSYNNLYIGNVDPNVSEEELRKSFGEYGEIESMLRPTRKVTGYDGKLAEINKNYVFISFKDSKVASTVIQELDGRSKWGRELDVNYYDANRKKANQAKVKTSADTQVFDQMAQSFMSALGAMMNQTGGNFGRGGRGGYGGNNQNYRGNNNYRGRGGRGSHRGRGRGGVRGGHPAPAYHARSQYEKPMMPQPMHQMMGMPPTGAPPVGPPTGMPPVGPPPTGGQFMEAPPQHPMPGSQMPPMTQPPPMSQPPMSQPPMSQPPMTQPPSQIPAQAPPAQEEKCIDGFNLSQVDQMTQEERENLIGTHLYNKLDPLCGGDVAGKITGMFLDLPVPELFDISTDDATFERYLKDARDLIENESKES